MAHFLAEGLGPSNGIDLIIVGLIAGVVFPLLVVLSKSGKK